jgi:nucleotide-binding universal stress UspA family protein
MARNPGVKSEWRASSRDALGAALLSARYADIVIAGQRPPSKEDDTAIARDFCEELVLAAGRPVLFVPYAGRFASFGKRVLVAWNASRESARAVTDALPILQRAETVQVVAFEPVQGGDHGDIPGADISLYLARHGVKVTAAQQRSEGVDVGSQVLSRAADLDADLIVMGAYGHSRLREIVLGGVTRTILESMTVPTLMSH